MFDVNKCLPLLIPFQHVPYLEDHSWLACDKTKFERSLELWQMPTGTLWYFDL